MSFIQVFLREDQIIKYLINYENLMRKHDCTMIKKVLVIKPKKNQ